MKCIILFSFVFYIVQSNALNAQSFIFEKSNKCGCNLDYTCENCAPCEKLKPVCELNNKKYEDFHATHLESCRNWFLEGYNVELINKNNGTIAVTLLLSPLNNSIQYHIELHILDEPLTNPVDNISKPANHSMKRLRVQNMNRSCRLVIPFNFTFLFSGTYQLRVTKWPLPSESSACFSKPFNISSLYKKNFLNDLEPVFAPIHRPQRQELFFMLHFGNFSTGLHPLSTVVKLKSKIDMSLNDCSGSGNEVAKYVMQTSDGICCDSFGENVINGVNAVSEQCPCKFGDNFQNITCTLRNISNGNYCIVVGFYDPRCKTDTIWTKSARYCMWSYNLTLSGNVTSTVVKMEVSSSAWTIVLPIMLLGAIVTASLVVYLYKLKCIHKRRFGPGSSSDEHSSDSSTISWLMKEGFDKEKRNSMSEILLLYPRDCDPFMNAMAEFRSFLKNYNCKVYDHWDEELYNSVVESCGTWSLQFIKKKNVKIILIISECSKRFEESFLRNEFLNYKEPKTLDSIFCQSLANIHDYFGKRFDSYQRIFVAQLEGSPAINFNFITPATMYTVPLNIKRLVEDLHRDQESKLSEIHRPIKFINAVDEYILFKNENPNYLDDLLILSL